MILPIGNKKPLNKYHKGFTLIELILVIFLISVLTALSTPLFKRTFSELELKNSSFNMAKVISYAQEMAIIEKTNYKLNFDFEKSKFWITKFDSSEGKAVYERINGRFGRMYVFPKGLGITCDKEKILFYPDGRADTAEIKIIDRMGNGYTLGIKGFAKHIRIEEIKK